MFAPNDILVYKTNSGDTTVWVAQRVVVEMCEFSEGYLRVCRTRYKQSLPPSWQSKASEPEFLLDYKAGESWRWGFKTGRFYYDVDTIPNRAPVYYRDRLPSKDELIAVVDANHLRGSRERQAEQRRSISEQVQRLVDNTDMQFYIEHKVGDKRVFDTSKAQQLTESVAWCKFIRQTIVTGEYEKYGCSTQAGFYAVCADILATMALEGVSNT